MMKNAENNLETKYPELAAQWHPTKNGDLKPCNATFGSNKKVWWVCHKGHEYRMAIASRIRGRGCPICSESYLEKHTRKILSQFGINFKEQVVFDDLTGVGCRNLSYDFGIIQNDNYSVLIECQGIQHYKPVELFGGEKQFEIQQLHDELKREYAKNHGIKLIEIKYDCTEQQIEETIKNILKTKPHLIRNEALFHHIFLNSTIFIISVLKFYFSSITLKSVIFHQICFILTIFHQYSLNSSTFHQFRLKFLKYS